MIHVLPTSHAYAKLRPRFAKALREGKQASRLRIRYFHKLSPYHKLEKKYGNNSPYLVGAIAAYINKTDDCFSWLEKAMKTRSSELIDLKVDPFLASIRNDPRYFDLLIRVKFP